MPASDPTEILLAHNRWATQNFIEVAADLPPDQLHREFEIGLGSVSRTLIHILGAMRAWGDLLAGRQERPRLEEQEFTPPQLQELLGEIADDFEDQVASSPLEDLVTGSRGGREYTFARGAVVTHVMTHGMHHRAQVLNMLRQLRVDPLPPSAVVEWMMLVDAS